MPDIEDPKGDRAKVLIEALQSLGKPMDFDALLERVAGGLASALGASHCGIFLADPIRNVFLPRVAVGGRPESPTLREGLQRPLDPRADPIVAKVTSSKATVTVNGSQRLLGKDSCASLGISAAAALPILVAGEIQGLVLALFDGVDGTLDPEGMEMAGAISGALTPVVELELLREESKRNLAEREDFWHMTSSVLEETELQRALELVCREARHITRAGGSAILLLEETGELGVAFSVGDGADWSDELLFQTMAPEPCTVPAEPVILHDLSRRLDIPEAEIIRDVIVVPLCVHGKSIGALQIVNPREKLPRDQLKAVTQLADRVAVVIEHFQLHDKRERMVILEERSRMARELHDSVTQSVYAVTVFAEAAARLLDRNQVADASRTLREVRDAALRALREMRGLIFELHPPEIDKIDLIEALQARLAAVEGRAGLKTEFLCPGVRSLPQDIKEGLYRIAQEALNNTMKHAHASKITLRLAESSTGVSLELEDDGVGFELDEGTSEGGLGLPGMRERAEAMNGTISIKTSPGGGTSITIDVPFDQTKATSAGC